MDARSYETLAERHRESLRRQARRLTGNSADAEDLVQETLLRGFTRASQIVDPATAGAWLATIQRRLFLNGVRRDRVRPATTPLSVLEENSNGGALTPRTLQTAADSIEAPTVARDEADAIFRAVGRLSPALRRVLILRDIDDLSYEEISEQEQIAPGTVRSRLFRARAEVRRLLPAMHRQLAEERRKVGREAFPTAAQH